MSMQPSPRHQLDTSLDPFAIACPTFGCRGNCYVCNPTDEARSPVSSSTLSQESPATLVIESPTDSEEKGCPTWVSCQQKRQRFLQKPFLVRLFGLTAVTTAILAIQSYAREMLGK